METERLILRPFTPEDWQDLHEYLSQDSVVQFEPYEVCNVPASKQEAIRRAGDERFWAVCLKASGKLIGNVYLAEQGFDTWMLGYVFNPTFQGSGYATEAAFALVDNVFSEKYAHRVVDV